MTALGARCGADAQPHSGPDRATSRDPRALPDFRVGLEDGVRRACASLEPRLGYVENLDPEVEAMTAKAAKVFEELARMSKKPTRISRTDQRDRDAVVRRRLVGGAHHPRICAGRNSIPACSPSP